MIKNSELHLWDEETEAGIHINSQKLQFAGHLDIMDNRRKKEGWKVND